MVIVNSAINANTVDVHIKTAPTRSTQCDCSHNDVMRSSDVITIHLPMATFL